MKRISYALIFLLLPCLSFGAEVTYYGAAGEVSGSLALLEESDCKCLIDVGSHYGEHPDGVKQETSLVGSTGEREFAFNPASIDAVILTHAHLDHTGRLPELYRKGFRGLIYATPPTKKILEVMLEMQIRYESERTRNWEWSIGYKRKGNDYFKAHWHYDCRWRNRISEHNKRRFRGSLFDIQKQHERIRINVIPCQVCAQQELRHLLAHFKTIPYNERTILGKGISFLFITAKHIPGSSSVSFEIATPNRSKVNIIFSGDVGSDMSRFLSEPEAAPKSDHVFVEGTYGNYSRDFSAEKEYQRFIQEIRDIINKEGIVWIPSFALDRSQRILYEIESAIHKGTLRSVSNIYLPSPTAKKITELYIDNPTWSDIDVSGSLRKIYSLTTAKEYLDLEDFEPKAGSIIITTSGMMDSAYSVGLIPKLLASPTFAIRR